MAAPFLDIELLGKGVHLINDFSEVLGSYIANIEIPEGTYVADTGATQTRFNWSGSIADLNFNISDDSGGKFSKYIDDPLKTGASGQFYWPASTIVTGLDNIVKGGFETVTPTNLDADSTTNQTLGLSLEGEGDIDAPFSANLNGEIDLWVEGVETPGIHFSNPVSGNFNTGNESMTTILEVPIAYDEESKLVSIGQYDFADFDFSPDLSDYWAAYYNLALKPIADWWNSEFKPITDLGIKVPNPIETVNSKVTDQIASGDDYAKKKLGEFISDQVNSSGVKPYVDASFMPLLKYSWNEKDYPAKFIDIGVEYGSVLDHLTGAMLEQRNGSYSHVYEETASEAINSLDISSRETKTSQRMKNLDKSKPARFTFYAGEGFSRKNADLIVNFSKSRGDAIALSRMKFDGLEDINYMHVESRKQFRKAKRANINVISYEQGNKIDLYFDENSEDRGLGDGGIFAILKGKSEALPTLVSSDFVII